MSFLLKSIGITLCLMINTSAEEPLNNLPLVSFEKEIKWPAVNDSVMGGLSQSQFIVENGSGFFKGDLSLRNNGGFASVRHSLSKNPMLAKTKHICLKVKGDGRTYQFRIYDNKNNRIAYKFEFKTIANKWLQVKIPIKSMQSSFRGRHMPGFIAPTADKISQISFLIADKKVGVFSLEIKSITFN